MTKFKKALTIILVFVMVLTLFPIQANAAKKVKLNKSKLSLYVGKSYKLKLKNNKSKIKWSSSKKAVATVSSKGKVKAKKKGSCKITAKVGKKKYVCKVAVKKKVLTIQSTPAPFTIHTPIPTTENTPVPAESIEPTITTTPSILPTIEPISTPSSEPSAKPTIIPDYKLHNPTVDDKTSVWDLVEFGIYPQSLYTPIEEPDDPKDNVTYIDNDGTSYLCRSNTVTTSKRVLNEETQKYETIYTTTTDYYYYKYEPIQWRVLNVSDNKALLLADKCLEYSQFNEIFKRVTWETCSLRRYLNTTFKENAFSQAEQDILISTNVINTRANPYSDAEGGNNTVDEIFLLDIYEMTKIDYGFCEERDSIDTVLWRGRSSKKRKCMFTDYANDGGTYDFKAEYINYCWWLRSPGLSNNRVATIDNDDGCIDYSINSGSASVYSHIGVRPSLTINIKDDSTAYKKIGTVDADLNYVIY